MKTFHLSLGRCALIAAALLLISSCSSDSNYDSSSPAEVYPPEEIPDNNFGEKYTDYGENKFVSALEFPISTFSVDCDGASYSNMRRWINYGQNPPAASVRIEEFLNYFTFDYPEPEAGHNISLDSELAVCPWNAEHLLMRVGIRGKDIPAAELPATNYVLLIDVSGSMSSPDKLGILQSGFCMLVDELREQDRIAIVVYAGSVGVALESTSCEEANKGEIKKAINALRPGGSTAGAAAIEMAYRIAVENFIPGGNNRIILGSDGDFNVGISSTKALVEMIEYKRDQGIYLTVLGVGGGNLNDAMMEQLADKGNGTYEYLDNVEQLKKVFIYERSKFYAVAKDCKIQVAFDPEAVEQYRLIGYENRKLNEEDFEDDEKDAGDIGASQTVTAIYEIIPKASECAAARPATLDVRYKKPEGGSSILVQADIDATASPIAQASANMRFASSVAGFGMLLKGSEFAGTADKAMVKSLAEGALGDDPHGYRAEFVTLVNKAKIK